MSDKLVIGVELEPEMSKKSGKKIVKDSKKAGKKSGDAFESSFTKEVDIGGILKGQLVGLAGIAAGIGLASIFKNSISAALEQEDAVKRLNTALKTTGSFSTAASSDLQEYASNLQKVTRFGDEVILNQLALAKSFGASNVQAKEVVTAAADMAEALGIDLQSATRNVAKTLGGYAGELGEVIPELKNLTAEQLKAGEGVKLLSKQFAGTAQQNVTTFSGGLDQVSNSFGDVLEEIGFFITKNESFVSALQGTVGYLGDFAAGLKGIREGILGIRDVPTDELGKLDQAIESNIDKSQLYRKTLADLKDGNFFGQITAGDARAIKDLEPRIVALDNEIKKQIETRKKLVEAQTQSKIKDDEEKASKEAALQANQLYAQAQITSIGMINEAELNRQAAVEELRARDLISLEEYEAAKLQIETDAENKRKELIMQRKLLETEASGAIAQSFVIQAQATKGSANETAKELKNLAVNGYGKAFSAMGRAIASGENANQAFVDSVKNTAGEAASAIGDYYILEGTGRIASSYGTDATGYQELAIGGALKVLGGALSGGGGSSSGVSTGGSSGGAVSGGNDLQATSALQEQDIERTEPQSQFVVNVQGDIFDTDATGTRLAEIFSDAGAKQGVLVTDTRFS